MCMGYAASAARTSPKTLATKRCRWRCKMELIFLAIRTYISMPMDSISIYIYLLLIFCHCIYNCVYIYIPHERNATLIVYMYIYVPRPLIKQVLILCLEWSIHVGHLGGIYTILLELMLTCMCTCKGPLHLGPIYTYPDTFINVYF